MSGSAGLGRLRALLRIGFGGGIAEDCLRALLRIDFGAGTAEDSVLPSLSVATAIGSG